ncbi:MAG: ATP-binding cassette domain-containing protein [Bacteroidales bacterium]|nr:ATP-binding cassette domain-containing protein [Bacteroidales bacterium]
MMNIKVETQNLKKHFPTPAGTLHAVDGVNLKIFEKQTLGVVGESGCGKSTLGRVIIKLLDSTAGKIYFDNQDVTNISKDELKKLRWKMQMIFQDPYSSVNPRMTVSQIIAEPLKIAKKFNKSEIDTRVDDLMKIVGLDSRYRMTYPHELDGGRRQRISIARALALNPSFVVCDEPVSALDVSIQAQILNLLKDLQDQFGTTFLFISHNLAVVKYISHYIMVMYLGVSVEQCSTEELYKNPLHPYTKALLSAVPIADIHHQQNRIAIKGELTSPINPPAGCRFAPRCEYAVERCFHETPVIKETGKEHFVACHLY